jgi:hypothetical protein
MGRRIERIVGTGELFAHGTHYRVVGRVLVAIVGLASAVAIVVRTLQNGQQDSSDG